MKLVIVVGVRPQFIKLAPLLDELRGRHIISVLNTNQHYDHNLSTELFEDLDINPPDTVLESRQWTRVQRIATTIEAIEKEIQLKGPPNALVVIGDSDPAYSGAIAANILGLRLIHIEAGLRSGKSSQPEERNRIVIDAASDLCFAPTVNCAENLRREGKRDVIVSGDLHLDAVMRTLNRQATANINSFEKRPVGYVLVTTHRHSLLNGGASLERIASALNRLDFDVIWVLHPGARARLETLGLLQPLLKNQRISILEPQRYSKCIRLIRSAELVMTDSGGVQREAYFLGVRCLVLRSHSEFPETMVPGISCLVDPCSDDLGVAVRSILYQKEPCEPDLNAFGNGQAAKCIVSTLEGWGAIL